MASELSDDRKREIVETLVRLGDLFAAAEMAESLLRDDVAAWVWLSGIVTSKAWMTKPQSKRFHLFAKELKRKIK